ncbi:MAG: glycerol kinase [Spirochaetales bacterium]|jgi:glycerol kinase|nr:glycerol kinase [Spirochaetales bacterium]
MEKEIKDLVLAVDAGGSGVRAFGMNRLGETEAQVFLPWEASHPEDGATEYDPLVLWETLKNLLHKLVNDTGVDPRRFAACGITNQRSSFCFWDRAGGEPLTPLISWQDVRVTPTAERMNKKPAFRLLKTLAGWGAALTRDTMLTATSLLELNMDHAITKVVWLMERDPELKRRCFEGTAVFGTLDSWFIYNLTGRREHVTDLTNASSTSLYNPFDLCWNSIFCKIFQIPMGIFPQVKNSSDHFGVLDESLLGVSIPITCAVGDQQSALFGHTCFTPGEVKISMGSGAFVNINVGPKGKLSHRGLFPLIAWRVGDRIQYMLEGQLATMGTLINWCVNDMAWFADPEEMNSLAEQCEDPGNLVFIPCPSGIRFPHFQPRMRTHISGLNLSSGRPELARGIINGFAHRLVDVLEGIREDTGVKIGNIKVDGGVSRSDVLLQTLADLSGCRVARSPEVEVTGRGAAYLAGLAVGFWQHEEELKSLGKNYRIFNPSKDLPWRRKARQVWQARVKNALSCFD